MSEELVEPTEVKKIKARTAFIVIQAENGSYYALNSLSTPIEAQAPASLQDIKVGCQEIRDAIVRTDIVNSITALFTQKPASEDPEGAQEVPASTL